MMFFLQAILPVTVAIGAARRAADEPGARHLPQRHALDLREEVEVHQSRRNSPSVTASRRWLLASALHFELPGFPLHEL